MSDELDEIRARIGIVELVGESVSLKRTGKNYLGLCPFHDDRRPSFNVSDQIGRYKCWSCGEAGDIFTWVMKTQNMTFPEAVEVLAKRAGVELKKRKPQDPSLRLTWQGAMTEALAFFRSQLEKSSEAQNYCERRGLTPEVLAEWEVGYAPNVDVALATHLKQRGYQLQECEKLFLVEADSSGGYFDKFRGRLIFPIRDERGELVAFGGRILGDGHPKYINSSDTPLYRKSRVLYGLNLAKHGLNEGKPPVLCEGYLDVIACHRAGVKTAVASLGTALSEDHAKLLARWSRSGSVVILYDADEAGEKAATRAAEMLTAVSLEVKVAQMPAGQDPDTLLKEAGHAAVQHVVDEGLSPTEFQLRRLDLKLKPEDEAYWVQAAEILATCPNALERAKHIQHLAPRYPALRDPIEAGRALRAMVGRHHPRPAGRPTELPQPSSKPKLGLKAAEALIFRAFLSDQYRREAWEVIREPDLFLTGKATALAARLKQAFGDQAPQGAAAEWLHRLESPEDEQLLTDLEFARDDRLNDEALRDTVAVLEKHREKRALEEVKQLDGDERLRQLQSKLKNLHS